MASIGPNTRYYLDRFLPVLKTGRGGLDFNWAAFFLNGLWLGSRRSCRILLRFAMDSLSPIVTSFARVRAGPTFSRLLASLRF